MSARVRGEARRVPGGWWPPGHFGFTLNDVGAAGPCGEQEVGTREENASVTGSCVEAGGRVRRRADGVWWVGRPRGSLRTGHSSASPYGLTSPAPRVSPGGLPGVARGWPMVARGWQRSPPVSVTRASRHPELWQHVPASPRVGPASVPRQERVRGCRTHAGTGRDGSCGPRTGVFLMRPTCVHVPVPSPLTKQGGHFQAEGHRVGPRPVTSDLILLGSGDGVCSDHDWDRGHTTFQSPGLCCAALVRRKEKVKQSDVGASLPGSPPDVKARSAPSKQHRVPPGGDDPPRAHARR